MSNREDALEFAVTSYRRDDAGNMYRLRETVRDSYHTEDGGFVPQRVLWSQESYVYSTDADVVAAEVWCDEVEQADYMNSF